jgi:uncharacterized protein (TIGR02996 family)
MSEREALLAAVCEQPDDDVPRLVFADWCEENGQPERAEFIRVQCRIAQLAEHEPERETLGARELALWKAHFLVWLKEVPAWARPKVGVSRGFVAELECTPAQFFNVSRAGAWKLIPLEWAKVHTSMDCVGEVLAPLPRTRVTTLTAHFAGSGKFFRVGRPLADCPALAQLRKLEIAGMIGGDEAAILAGSPHLANLTSLGLEAVFLGAQGMAALAGSPYLAKLRTLTLDCCQLGEPEMQALAESPGFPALEEVSLSHNALRNGGVCLLMDWPSLGGLRRLALNKAGVGTEAARTLAASPRLSNLLRLELYNNYLDDEGVRALASSPHLARLVWLDLGNNPISDAGALALARSPHLAGIARLRLDQNTFGAQARKALRDRFGARVRLYEEG